MSTVEGACTSIHHYNRKSAAWFANNGVLLCRDRSPGLHSGIPPYFRPSSTYQACMDTRSCTDSSTRGGARGRQEGSESGLFCETEYRSA